MTGVESILLEELDWIVCQSHVGDGVGLHGFGFALKLEHFGKMFTWLLSEFWTMTLLSHVYYCLWQYDGEADDWLKMVNEMYVMAQLTHETRI